MLGQDKALRLRFGIFEFRALEPELRRQGVRLKLQEQPLRVLGLLLEHPGEVVTREAIYERLWAQNSAIDCEHGLNTSIAKLRQALRDSAESPRFVETVARQGYRFIAPVEQMECEPAQAAEAAQPVLRTWRPPHQAAAWSAAVIVVAGAGVLYSSRSRFGPEIPTNAKQFTSYPGQPSGPVFSPDGKEVAFIWNGPNRDNFDIYVKAVDGAEPRRLTTNSARDLDPAWSRDGRYIAFRREIGAHCGIFVIPAGGGPERKVAETVVPFASGTPMRDAMSGMSWSADGDHLLVVDTGRPGHGPNAIVSVSTVTGEKRILTSPPAGMYDTYPTFADDGRSLAFSRGRVAMGPVSIYVQGLDSQMVPHGQPRLVFENKFIKLGLAWTPSASGLIFGMRGQCWVAPASGGGAKALPGLCEIPTSLSVAAKTGMLAYTRQPNSDENIYSLPLPVPDGRGNPASLFVSSPESDYSAEYSPDGTKVALVSRRSGHLEIWVCTASGADCSPITSMRGPEVGSPKWSADGLQIAFDSDQGGHDEIYTVAVEGGAPRRITTEKSHQARPNWSADGRWIYFASDREDGWQL